MSKPDLFPSQSTSGIAVDPRTLERVIPESRRPDGTVRKQIKIRPGFTPQEDVSRFKGTRQLQKEATALPKGHIIGWMPPPSTSAASSAKTKAAKKNEKRKEKRKAEKGADSAEVTKVKDDWEDDDEEEGSGAKGSGSGSGDGVANSASKPNRAEAPDTKESKGARSSAEDESELADKLGKLDVR
ncbi:hypothetical protein BXZ70DRAFT_918584 [Cristinia sonorae]|uniref:WIBG Mago-binding domain-containing protein n=1 Tax=Cristinia sonorae TaxID=1940300 RepID=A0A8K0UXT4_9AGAR|nr:hypothetical protein BXZ70DRAFT_918584 [Cristinia sonorae]